MDEWGRDLTWTLDWHLRVPESLKSKSKLLQPYYNLINAYHSILQQVAWQDLVGITLQWF